MGSREQLDLEASRVHPFYDSIHLVRLSTRLSNLGNYDIAVHVPVYFGVALHPYQTMLLGVVQPVTGPTRPNNSLELVGLDPDYLLDPLVAPNLETLPA